MWIFGKGKKKDKADKKAPIDIQGTQKSLDDQARMTGLNIQKYEAKCKDITSQAKALLKKKDKKGATKLVKKKKMYEKEIAKLEGM